VLPGLRQVEPYQPFCAPNRTNAPGPSRPASTFGPFRRTAASSRARLRDDGAAGIEVQVYRDRELLYGRRLATRALALKEADERKAQYLSEGGVLIA
jgi:hypothetical protein